MRVSTGMVGRLAAVAAAMLYAGLAAAAVNAWKPEQTIESVVGTGAGSGSDATARLVQRLCQEKRLIEVPSTVVNKVGGGGVLGLTYMAQNAGSSRHLFVTSPTLLTNHIMGKTALNYTDLTPLAQIGTEYVAFSVSADSPLKAGTDLVARVKLGRGRLAHALPTARG